MVEIGNNTFTDCKNLTEITIANDSLTHILSGTFNNCSNLKNVYITNLANWCKTSFGNDYANPLIYGADLYVNKEKLTHLTVPSTVK